MNDATEKKVEAQVILTIKPVGQHSEADDMFDYMAEGAGTTNNNVFC